MLEAALGYAKQGLAVFPALPGTKVPATPDGLKSATTDEKQIREWWGKNPQYNIGIRTGQISNLVVVDLDFDHFTEESEQFCAEHLTIDTAGVITGGDGYHKYHRCPEGVVIRNRVNIRPGIDLRSENGYVIAPPSVHESGRIYEWDVNAPEEFGELPAVLHQKEEPAKLTRGEGAARDAATYPEGGRNAGLTADAGRMQRQGVLTLEGLLALNEQKCDPPLPESEVETIYESVSRYEPKDPLILDEDTPQDVSVSAVELLPKMLEYISNKDRVLGQPTGFAGLDRLLGGGFRRKEMVFLSATAKTGKTSAIIQTIYNLLESGVPAAFASQEMDPAEEILPVLLSIAFNETVLLKEATEENKEKYRKKLEEWPRLVFLKGYGAQPLTKLEQWIQENAAKGIKHFFADHAHFLCEGSQDYKVVVDYVTKLKAIIMREDVFLLLVVQPSTIADGQQLDMAKLKGGSAMSQVMNALLVLERYKVNGQIVPNVAKLTLDAKRSTLARLGSIFLQYDPKTNAIFEVEPAKVQDPAPPGYGEENAA